MAKRVRTSAPPIDDHSGLNIEGTITYLSNQVAGQKNIFTRAKLISVDTLEAGTEVQARLTRITTSLEFHNQKATFSAGLLIRNI